MYLEKNAIPGKIALNVRTKQEVVIEIERVVKVKMYEGENSINSPKTEVTKYYTMEGELLGVITGRRFVLDEPI